MIGGSQQPTACIQERTSWISSHHWSIPPRLAYFLPGRGFRHLPQGLLESLAVFLWESAQWILSHQGEKRVGAFPQHISREHAVDLSLHILEWLCKLFTREPKFNGYLFILSLDGKIEYQTGTIKDSESANEAVHMLCHYYWRKTEMWTLKNSRNGFSLSLKKLE